MQLAISKAQEAYNHGEVPVGAIIIDENSNIISSTYNLCERNTDVTAHAEILAIRAASKKLSNKFLNNCTMFVTLEPCPMCAQAISNARIKTLIIGAEDEKSGGVLHGVKIFESNSCHHKPEVISGILKDECSNLMKDFFRSKRNA